MWKAIHSLDDKHCIPIVLRYYHDLPVADIAEILKIPSGTVHSRLNHARERLRVLWEEETKMNGISHEQAQRFIRAELDGLLTEALRHDLEAHLRECEACRVESESLSMLTMRLRSNFQGRWDAQDGPSQKVMANIHSQTRRIILSNRIRFGLRTLAGIGALIMLGFLINFAFAQLRNPSITVSGPDATNGVLPAKQSPLIAFVSDQNGNSEIYTVNTDGTDLTNLTNNPANDTSPAWSPDGTRLAFLSDRNGQWDIFLMRSDGSELTQLTDGKEIGNGFSWSPNGKQIAYSAISTQDPRLQSIVIMNSNGSDVQEAIDGLSGGLINDSGLINNKRADDIYLNWSPDGSKLAFLGRNRSIRKGCQNKILRCQC